MDEFDLDLISDDYSTSIKSIKSLKDNVNKPEEFPCESVKCKKYTLEPMNNLKYSDYLNDINDINNMSNINTVNKLVNTNLNYLNNTNNNENFKNSKLKIKKKHKSNYDFYLIILLFIYCNNYSFVVFLSRFRINYYTSLFIRLVIFCILFYFSKIYIKNL